MSLVFKHLREVLYNCGIFLTYPLYLFFFVPHRSYTLISPQPLLSLSTYSLSISECWVQSSAYSELFLCHPVHLYQLLFSPLQYPCSLSDSSNNTCVDCFSQIPSIQLTPEHIDKSMFVGPLSSHQVIPLIVLDTIAFNNLKISVPCLKKKLLLWRSTHVFW